MLSGVHWILALVASLHVVGAPLMGARRSIGTPVPVAKKPNLQKMACDGCGCIVHRTVFGVRALRTLCDGCAQRLLNGEPLAEVLAGKKGGSQ